MASSTKRSARKGLLALLAIVLGLAALAGGLATWSEGSLAPRLGLDLEGGTEMVLEPVLVGSTQVSPGQIDQAVDIIRQRIDANGVSESEISMQGGRNIVVSIPGQPTKDQLDAIRKPSQLRFRAVFVQAISSPAVVPQPSGTATGTSTGTPTGTATATATGAPTGTATGTPAPTSTGAPTAAKGVVPQAFVAATTPPTPTATAPAKPTTTSAPAPATTAPTVPPAAEAPAKEDPAAVAAQVSKGLTGLGWDQAKANTAATTVAQQYVALDCAVPGSVDKVLDDPALPIATCGDDRATKYVLGPVEIDGSEIADATSGFQPGPNGAPTSIVEVALSFKDAGKKKFADVTRRLYAQQGNPPLDQFAVVLDKTVITAPQARAVITDGRASITGSFTVDSAKQLAQQLKFGALPLSFRLQTQDDITPQLGQEQLALGLLAGAIGLLLVVVYSLLQYRALGLVTVASLVVAASISYLAVTILGTTHGFRLTMAGVTGLIVAIGVTADSFIVYFERIRDEVRDGRPLVAAVETGWKRARRTILAADAVNFIAAVVLYLLASSNVRGFAFTLGLTTVIDLVVVMLFTHPTVQLLARTTFFGGGHRWSGLDPERLGAKESPRYRGRGQFGVPAAGTARTAGAAPIAEGKAHA
ncbi:MAG TPA: protein translocase subunit SecD [Intrasporangium sp.]|uniref:protein translocase subunit SecD n=1 Tax=Intrasporangium sp. TaxID=1925024 RepID=UPI002D79664E|nr:protein translocase subunit SecD [Intrasporangium sp.]HET7398211.1 protein translocase subunit SecD [Intrasporangium sp.]